MTFFLNSALLLASVIPLSGYHEKYNSTKVKYAFEKKRMYTVDKSLDDKKILNTVDDESLKDAFERWKSVINKTTYYRLQFYNNKNRSQAMQLLRNLSNKYPSIIFDVKYEHSNFIVLSQKYFSFIEALSICKSIGYIDVIIIHGEDL